MSLCTYGHIQKGAHERAEIPLQRLSLHDHEADSATRIYPPTSDDAPLETAGPTRCSNGAHPSRATYLLYIWLCKQICPFI